MQEIKLDSKIRDKVGSRKIKGIRNEGLIPAVVYGLDSPPMPIQLDRKYYEKIMRGHQGEHLIFHINVMDGNKTLKDYSAIVVEEQHNPVTNEIFHIDFKRISLTEEIEISVPVEAKGEAPGVKVGGGSLEHVLWELDIICLPTNIPSKLFVDVSNLEINDAVYVKDVLFPEGISTNHDPEAIVITVAPPMREEAAPVVEEAAAGPKEPEVIKEKKEKEEAKAEEKK